MASNQFQSTDITVSTSGLEWSLEDIRRLKLNPENALITPYLGEMVVDSGYEQCSAFKNMYEEIVKVCHFSSGSADFHQKINNLHWRGHAYFSLEGLSVCLKQLPSENLALEQLGFTISDLLPFLKQTGLVLFVGPIDNGKSTSMISAMKYLYEHGDLGETITIEQPVEYIFEEPEISQRRVNIDVSSFEEGIVDAVRESPTTIVIGEIRDRPSAHAAIRAGMLGHRVLSTLHGHDIIDGISNLFALLDKEHDEMLPHSLSGVVAQHLFSSTVPNKKPIMVYETLEIDREATSVLMEGVKNLRQLGNCFNKQNRHSLRNAMKELANSDRLNKRDIEKFLEVS